MAACDRRSFIGWMHDDGWIHANDVGAVVHHHKLSVLHLPLEQGPRFALGRQTLGMHDQRQVLSHCHTNGSLASALAPLRYATVAQHRKSVVEGKGVAVRVEPGGGRFIT